MLLGAFLIRKLTAKGNEKVPFGTKYPVISHWAGTDFMGVSGYFFVMKIFKTSLL